MRVATLSRNERSCVTVTMLPLKSHSRPSSHSMLSRSRWLVGSSSSSTSGAATSACASATRFLLPPESVLISRIGVQVQPVQGLVHALLPVPAVQRFDLALHGVQVAVALAILVDQFPHPGQACADSLEHSGVRIELRLLRHIGNAGVALHLQGAVVGLFQPAQNFEQRGLASAIAADQADALLRFQRKSGVIQQRDVSESQLSVK